MAYTVKNQTPAVLDANYSSFVNLKQDADPVELLTKNISQKLFTNSSTVISYNNQDLTPDDLTQLFMSCLDKKIDPNNEKLAKELFIKTVLNYQNSMRPFRESYGIIAALKNKMPLPTPHSYYTINTDVIPASKQFLLGSITPDALFANFAFTFAPQTVGFAFKNSDSFEDFKKYFGSIATAMSQKLDADAQTKIQDFLKLTLNDLTENLLLRNKDTEGQDPFSFQRILMYSLLQYAKQNKCVYMPFDIGESYNPKSLILINIDSHAHNMPSVIKRTWDDIKKALAMPVKTISNKHLTKLMSISRMQSNAQARYQARQQNHDQDRYRAKLAPLANTRPTQTDIFKHVALIMKHMQDVNQSSNIYKSVKRTFNKPNRRHPDDYNLAGKSVSTHYRPDLHIYLDTSGSISESNYESGIKACIYMAKKLNVDLYFNSFSDIISEEIKLPLRGKSNKEIYAYFQIVPKVNGGTEFYNVWNYINAKKKRQKELSIMITDFGDRAPNTDFVHPKNLYYMAIDGYDYDAIRQEAEYFLDSMNSSGHDVRKHILL